MPYHAESKAYGLNSGLAVGEWILNPDCAVASCCAFRYGFLRLATDYTAQSGLKFLSKEADIRF